MFDMATANLSHASAEDTLSTPFVNEAFVDFTMPENKRAMEAALAEVERHLGQEYDIIIGGKRIQTAGKIVSVNPAEPAQVVGIHQRAAAEHVEGAVQSAQTAFTTWKQTITAYRADLLFRVAEM